uniref:Mediator of RNA polymerase II transcription subunit 26 n=1 Tax=Stomoxys calcitrans TaxID=35570 RepID=A0A1I8PVT5_STOCA
MLKLQWSVYIWALIGLNCVDSQPESNVDYFQILKYPAEHSGYEFNNNSTLELCYDGHGPCPSGAVDLRTSTSKPPSDTHIYSLVAVYNAILLNILGNIAQQIRQSQLGQKSKRPIKVSTRSHSAVAEMESEAKTMASAQRSLRVYVKGQQRPEDLDERFDILEQLKLDEQNEQQQQQQQQEQQGLKFHLQSQSEMLQQMNEQQPEFWEDVPKDHQGKADKRKRQKKKKKKKKKPATDKNKNRKKKKNKNPTKPLVGQPAHVLFASLTQRPQFQQPLLSQPLTTSKPQHNHHQFTPLKKIKYVLRKNTIFKKKKKEYLNHLKHVLYPFVKFIAFFTVLNPFTLAVFLFALISPVVFGFIGFIGLSFLIKPALNLLFGVKRTVSSINRKKLLEKRHRERLRQSRRPITIHKHYYQQTRLPAPHHRQQHPHTRLHQRRPQHQQHRRHRQSRHFNPLLPQLKRKFKEDTFVVGSNFFY